MVEPVNEAAAAGAKAVTVGKADGGKKEASEAASATDDARFSDDLFFLDFSSVHCPPPSVGGVADEQLIFQEILDQSDDGLAGLAIVGGGVEGEEEELEWLSNKDAFPPLETSFEIFTHSRSSSGAASMAGAGAERSSPVCVLQAAASFSVPGRPRTKGRRRRRSVLAGLSPPVPPVAAKLSKKAGTRGTRKTKREERRHCLHCDTEETPQWRTGPEGPKTLCNACGVRYKSGRLVPEYRPASSPTFSPAVHSNSHRRIMEIRRRKAAAVERRNTMGEPAVAAALPLA